MPFHEGRERSRHLPFAAPWAVKNGVSLQHPLSSECRTVEKSFTSEAASSNSFLITSVEIQSLLDMVHSTHSFACGLTPTTMYERSLPFRCVHFCGSPAKGTILHHSCTPLHLWYPTPMSSVVSQECHQKMLRRHLLGLLHLDEHKSIESLRHLVHGRQGGTKTMRGGMKI